MIFKTKGVLPLILLISLVSAMGCATSTTWGKTVLTSRTDDKMTIEKLAANWEAYHVYTTGPEEANPWGILFDKKDDGKRLICDHWDKLRKGKSIPAKARMMFSLWPVTRLYSIIGPEPEREFYGYIYTPFQFLLTKKIDDDTLYVYVLQAYDGRFTDGSLF